MSDEHCGFQIQPFVGELTGDITIDIVDLDNLQPTTVVNCNSGAEVRVHWDIHGHLKKHLCGKWCVCVHLESIGPGPEISVKEPCAQLDWETCNDGGWDYVVTIPKDLDEAQSAEICDESKCGRLYQIAVTLTSRNGCDEPGHIAAYCKGPCIMFFSGEES